MTTAPFEPNPPNEEEIAAADPGRGAPKTAPGFGPTAIDPDRVDDQDNRPNDESESRHSEDQPHPYDLPG